MKRPDLPAIRRRAARGYTKLRDAVVDVRALVALAGTLERRLTKMQRERVVAEGGLPSVVRPMARRHWARRPMWARRAARVGQAGKAAA